MALRILRFVNLALVVLALGLTWCHVAERVGKLRLPGEVWIEVQHNLYVAFAPIGAISEVGAILTAWLLVVMVRPRRPALALTLAGALLATAGLVSWFLLVAPVNEVIAAISATTLPADWASIRRAWEDGHTIGFALFAAAFASLLAAILADTRP